MELLHTAFKITYLSAKFNPMEIVQIIIGLSIGIIITSIITYLIYSKKTSQLSQHQVILQADQKRLLQELETNNNKIQMLENELLQARLHVAAIDTENTHLIKTNQEKEKEVTNLHSKLSKEFEDIANRVLIHRSKEMNELSQQRMNDILTPLKEKIVQFEKKVEDTYEKEVRDNLSLKAEVKRLFDLNHKISEEAGNLTKALKGNVKKLGNWGEMILERVLEQSGLTNGREYRREVVDKNSNGETIRPDVIIDLPENKHLIIDSKLTLSAYEEFVNIDNEETKAKALRKHQDNLRLHIKNLHEKNYSSAQNTNTPDFVLMFIPVEASFAVAVENDSELFAFAWEKKIVPVSPSTLLATLKTISSIWRQENQNKNAQEIARQSGALYDKLVNFLVDFEKIGNNIDQIQSTYSNAMSKLQNGKGNLITRAEKIKSLGAKNNKSIPDKFIS